MGVGVLTVFSASDVGQDPEALGLQVGSAASPFRHILSLSWPDHCLVNWRRTVYHRVLDRESSTAGEKGLLELIVRLYKKRKSGRTASRTVNIKLSGSGLNQLKTCDG